MDFNELMRRGALNSGGGDEGGGDEAPKSMDDFFMSLFEMVSKWASKSTGIKFDSLMKTGVHAHAKIEQGGLKSTNPVLQGGLLAGSKGGVLANIAGVVFPGVDFAKIVAPAIERAYANISEEMLGGLTPSAGGSRGHSTELGH